MTQKELARATKLTINDVSRLERGRFLSMEKVIAVADYLDVTVDALLTNDFSAVLPVFSDPARASHRRSLSAERASARRGELGRQGEEWVAAQEVKKLKGTPYANAVSPNHANCRTMGFDILSFDRSGVPICIEVKTTAGDAERSFFMTEAEYKMAKECHRAGVRYEVHRVYHIGSRDVGRVIIPAERLLADYSFHASRCYEVELKRRQTG